MTKEKTLLLNNLLSEFFSEGKFGSSNYLSRNKTASLLKKNLSNLGHWKNKARNKSPNLPNQMLENQFLIPKLEKDCPF